MGWWKDDDDIIIGDAAWYIFGVAIQEVERAYQRELGRDPKPEEIEENFRFVFNGWLGDRAYATAQKPEGLTTRG